MVAAPISKYDLLVGIREAFGLDVEIVSDETEVSDRSMCGDKLRAAIGYEAPGWGELLAGLAEDGTPWANADESSVSGSASGA